MKLKWMILQVTCKDTCPFCGRDCDTGISRKEVQDLKNESKFIFEKFYNIKKSFCKMDIPSF